MREKHQGAITALKEYGIEIPERPKGYTSEEEVFSLLADFRDAMIKLPSDPKEVARATQENPIVAINSVEDFGELVRSTLK